MLDVAAALASIKNVDEAVGIISKLAEMLKGKPDLAALKLADALNEIAKTWQVIDEAATNILKLGIDKDALASGSKELLAIEGGRLLIQVEDGRGHCHDIQDIFEKYLNRWFDRVLKGDDLAAMNNVFEMLGDADDDVFSQMDKLANELQVQASAVLNLVINGQSEEAKSMVLALRGTLLPLRLAISKSLSNLYALKSQFVAIASAV